MGCREGKKQWEDGGGVGGAGFGQVIEDRNLGKWSGEQGGCGARSKRVAQAAGNVREVARRLAALQQGSTSRLSSETQARN